MSIVELQRRIRQKKTPAALVLGPAVERLDVALRRKFTEMYGEGPMADAESLRCHGTQTLDAAGERVAAVVLDADAYVRYGAMGFDVLANLVSAAKARDLYTIVDCRAATAAPWLAALPQADAVTVLPYLGADAAAGADGERAVFAAVTTGNESAGELQRLIAGDRKLFLAAAEQQARRGAGILLESGYALDIRDVHRRLDGVFLLLRRTGPQAASCAFDDYGHGALWAAEEVQYAPDAAAALDAAIREIKEWVSVV